MEGASSDVVAFVDVLDPFGRGLDVQFYFLYVARRFPPQSSLASREERSQCESGSGGIIALVEDPLLPGEFGLCSRTSTIHEGPSLTADLIDRTLVNVSSWYVCVTGD